VKPAVWGAIAGAIAAMIIGFVWGGWVTGGTSATNATAAAQTAVVQAFVPLCVAKAEQQPDQLPLMRKEGELLLTVRLRGQSRIGFQRSRKVPPRRRHGMCSSASVRDPVDREH
jgi:hypothetical protein